MVQLTDDTQTHDSGSKGLSPDISFTNYESDLDSIDDLNGILDFDSKLKSRANDIKTSDAASTEHTDNFNGKQKLVVNTENSSNPPQEKFSEDIQQVSGTNSAAILNHDDSDSDSIISVGEAVVKSQDFLSNSKIRTNGHNLPASAIDNVRKRPNIYFDHKAKRSKSSNPEKDNGVIDLTVDDSPNEDGLSDGDEIIFSKETRPPVSFPTRLNSMTNNRVTQHDILDDSDDDIIVTGEKVLTNPSPHFNSSPMPSTAPMGFPAGIPLSMGQFESSPFHPPSHSSVMPGLFPSRHMTSHLPNYNQPIPLPNGITHGAHALTPQLQSRTPLQPPPRSEPFSLTKVMVLIHDKYRMAVDNLTQTKDKIKALTKELNTANAHCNAMMNNLSSQKHKNTYSSNISQARLKIVEISKKLSYFQNELKLNESEASRLQKAENSIRAQPQLAMNVFNNFRPKVQLPTTFPKPINHKKESPSNTFEPNLSHMAHILPNKPTPLLMPGTSLVTRRPFNEDIDDVFGNDVPRMDDDSIAKLIDNIQPDDERSDDNMVQTPHEMTITLLKHQRMGLEWLLKMENSSNRGGILADAMGLGKTVQSIALILSNKPNNPKRRTTLIIGPVALLRQWQAEISNKVKPEFKIKTYLYHSSDRLNDFHALNMYDVVLVSYGTVSSEYKKHYKEVLEAAGQTKDTTLLPNYNSGGRRYKSAFFEKNAYFHRIILDEAHISKNKKTLTAKACHMLRAEFRWCLTGTPMQNKVDELYALIRFLRIKPYDDEKRFRSMIVLPMKNRQTYDLEDSSRAMRRLQALLKAILLRRNKDSKIDNCPILQLTPRIVEKEVIVMDGDEEEFYKSLSSEIQIEARKLLNSEKIGNYSSALTLLLRLRQACCHSFLVRIGDRLKQINEGEVNEDLNLETTEERSANDKNLVQGMIERCGRINEGTIARINQDFQEGDMTCPLCYDGLIETNTSIMYPCGHCLCSECVEPLFQNFAADEEDSAKCPLCSRFVQRADIVHFSVFDQICNKGQTKKNVAQQYGVDTEDVSKESPQKAIINTGEDTLKALKMFFPMVTSVNGLTIKQKIIGELIAAQENEFHISPKMRECLKIIENVQSTASEDKIIIFSQFTSFFDLFGKVLREKKIPFLRYDGSMSMDERDSTISEFFASQTKKVLLISLKAGNVGLTLTCASHVIIVDPFWNPYVEEQAMDRAHRIGQLKTVYVHRLLTQETVEDRIVTLQEKKRELVENALNESGFKQISRLGREELRYLFGISNRAPPGAS